MPRIVAVRSGDTYKGDDWIGLKMRDASVVRGIGVLPVFAGLLGLLLLLGSLAGTWAREGRLSSAFPIRPDRSRHALERAIAQVRRPEAAPDRPGPASSTRPGGIALEAALP